MLAGFFQLALKGQCLGQVDMDRWIAFIEVEGALPAIDRLVEQAAFQQAVGDVEIATRAFLFVLAGDVEGLFGLLVIAHGGVDGDALAIGRLVGGIETGDMVEARQGLIKPSQPGLVYAHAVKGFDVVGLDAEGFGIGLQGLVIAAQLIQGEADVEIPGTVVGIHGDGGTELVQGLLPLLLGEEFLCLLDTIFSILPVVHGVRPLKRTLRGPYTEILER